MTNQELKLLTYQPKNRTPLNYVSSFHEQREFNKEVIPHIGSWIETGTFTRITESWDIKERFLCKDIHQDNDDEMTMVLEKLDYEAMMKESEALANKILEKHGESLYQSLKFMIIKGMVQNRKTLSWEHKTSLERVMKASKSTEYKHMQKKMSIDDLKGKIEKTKITMQNYENKLKKLEGEENWELNEKQQKKF